jgi:hypothetical protein
MTTPSQIKIRRYRHITTVGPTKAAVRSPLKPGKDHGKVEQRTARPECVPQTRAAARHPDAQEANQDAGRRTR